MKKLLLLLLLIPSVSFAQSLSDVEQSILSSIESNHDEAVDFLIENVNMNTGSMNPEGVQALGKRYIQAYNELGFETEWVDQSEVNRGGHFIARKKGTSGLKLLLIGHLDTVFEPNSPFQKAEMLNDSTIAGPGIADMKGGNVMILYALKALNEAGALEDATITVVLTGDEEKAGKPTSISRYHLVEAAKQSDIALGFEGASGWHYATVARRSSNSWLIEIEGVQAHSSGVFSERVGAGSVYEAGRILHRFYNELQEEYLTFNAAMIVGGNEVNFDDENQTGEMSGKTNIVPKKTVIKGDLRYLTEDQGERVVKKMEEIVSESLPQTTSTFTFNKGYPPMAPTDGNMKVLDVLSGVSEDMGIGPVEAFDPGRRGAADISFVANYIEGGLDGLGVIGRGAHSPNEMLHTPSYMKLTQRAALLIYRLTQMEKL
ncbi:MAG: M20/M25/M40 family metallo-hydrolase [Balneolaceae bacterium]|nr:M20/M25/M40 family metallo-hydrolase [Balneolaceae bacterium]